LLACPFQVGSGLLGLERKALGLTGPGVVARACNPSGGIKVVWMFGADAGPEPVVVPLLACPFQVGSGLLGLERKALGLTGPGVAETA